MRRLLLLALLVATPASAAETITYVYDARGRVVQVSRSGTINDGVQTDYRYDRADNRTRASAGVATFIEILYAGQSASSSDGRFHLTMQTDGNLVLHGPAGFTWASWTQGGSDRRMVMQTDGNLVVYNSADQGLWHTGTYGNPGARLWLQNDGNLVIRSATSAVLWATGTAS